jgi:hypothetical protein
VVNTATVDYGKFAILIHPSNIYVGFHRRVRIERWRDPREMCTYFIPSVRFAVAIADPNAAVLAYNIPAFAMPAAMGFGPNPFMPWPAGPTEHSPQPIHTRQQAELPRQGEGVQPPHQSTQPAQQPGQQPQPSQVPPAPRR